MIVWSSQFINEDNADALIVSKFKLLTDDVVNDILDIVNENNRTFIYCTVSQETSATLSMRLNMLERFKKLSSKIVIVKPFENDTTVMGAKKYVSYIPDIIYKISRKYPSSHIKNVKTELPALNVQDMIDKAIDSFKKRKKRIRSLKNLNILPNIKGVSDETIKQLLYTKELFDENTKILNLVDMYDEFNSFYNSINESLTFRDLNKQYIRDDFVLFNLMKNTSKVLYKNINVITANFDTNVDDEDDYSLTDVSFDVPKNDPFCRITINNLLDRPSISVNALREITLDDSRLANDLNQFLNIIGDFEVEK